MSESVKAAFVQNRILNFHFYEKHKGCICTEQNFDFSFLRKTQIQMQPWEACILCSFSTSSSVTIIEIVHFTVVHLVAKPLNWSKAKGDLVMIQMGL